MRMSVTKVILECSPDVARQVMGEHYYKQCFHENVDGVYRNTHTGTTQHVIFRLMYISNQACVSFPTKMSRP
jgi:hypothetical protein